MAAHIQSLTDASPHIPFLARPRGRHRHQYGVFYMLVCRVTLGYSCRTRAAHVNMDTGGAVFTRNAKQLGQCHLMPDGRSFEYHSLVAETGGLLDRYREFIVYDKQFIVPMYLIAYHRLRKGESV